MDNTFRVFNYARDLDPLIKNRRIISAALQAVFNSNSRLIEIVEAQVYKPHPNLTDVTTALAKGPYNLLVAAMTKHDMEAFSRVLDDLALTDGIKVALCGIPPDDDHIALGVNHLNRPDGYFQPTDIGVLVEFIKTYSPVVLH